MFLLRELLSLHKQPADGRDAVRAKQGKLQCLVHGERKLALDELFLDLLGLFICHARHVTPRLVRVLGLHLAQPLKT